MSERAVLLREIPHSSSSFKNDENEMNLDVFLFYLYVKKIVLGEGVHFKVDTSGF